MHLNSSITETTDAKHVDLHLAQQSVGGYGVPSQDPSPAAQVGLNFEEAEREAKSVLIGGGVAAGIATSEAKTPCLAALVAVMRQRRSVRAYLPEPIPDPVLEACFDLAILAPTSHNLECWQMIDVRDSNRLAALRHLCLDQPAAAAPHLIVAVARPDQWRPGRTLMLEHIQQEKADPTLPKALREFLPLFELKYRLQIPFLFMDGPFHILAPFKRILVGCRAWFKPMMRGPFGRHEQALWAVKTAALACENLMLAFTAHGFDSCPMEGFDEPRVKRLLGLPRAAEIVMVIAAGRGAEGGVIPQIRFSRAHYIARA